MTNLLEEEINLLGESNLPIIKEIFGLKDTDTLDKIDKELIKKKVEENIDKLNELEDIKLGDIKYWTKIIKGWRKHLKDFKKDKKKKSEVKLATATQKNPLVEVIDVDPSG